MFLLLSSLKQSESIAEDFEKFSNGVTKNIG